MRPEARTAIPDLLVYACDGYIRQGGQPSRLSAQPLHSIVKRPAPRHTMHEVFLSHNSADKEQVEHIAKKLLAEPAGDIKPWFDAWEIIPGQRICRCWSKGFASARSVLSLSAPMVWAPA